MSAIVTKDQEWDEFGATRSSRNHPRVIRTVRRYKYPLDDYNTLDDELNRIVIRDTRTYTVQPSRSPSPDSPGEEIEVIRYEEDSEESDHHHHNGETASRHSHQSHQSHESRQSQHSHNRQSQHSGAAEEMQTKEYHETFDLPDHQENKTRRRIDLSPTPSESRSHTHSTLSTPRTTIKTAATQEHDELVVAPIPAESPYTIEKYTKSTEYFARPESGPILIRNNISRSQQPIIIREDYGPREIIIRNEIHYPPAIDPNYQLVERPAPQNHSLRRQTPPEDDYYFERQVRKERLATHRDSHNEHHEHRHRRSRSHAREKRDYFSDDEVEYRRTVRTQARSPDQHRRHILEGAIGGAIAGEIARRSRKRAGEDPGSHLAAIGGMGALGAIGAEALSRAKEWDRDRNSHRSRPRSSSRVGRRDLLAGAAAVAALGGAALVANRNKKKTESVNTTKPIEEGPRTSRSRHKSRSSSVVDEGSRKSRSHHTSRLSNHARDHGERTGEESRRRKQRATQAGIVGASLAALHGSSHKSRNRSRSRSRSTVRDNIPIVAAGLGTAAAASLYERRRANKEARERSSSGSRSKSRSRSRSTTRQSSARTVPHRSDSAMFEYGDEPIVVDQHPGQRNHRSVSRGRYGDESRSRSRNRSRYRSQSRTPAAPVEALTGTAALSALENSIRRREERRAQRDRRRRAKAEGRPVDDSYTESSESSQYYPAFNAFPPPPPAIGLGTDYPTSSDYPASPEYPSSMFVSQPISAPPRAYNPADYGPTTGPTLPPEDYRYYSQTERYPPEDLRGVGPENVSEPMAAAPRSTVPDDLEGACSNMSSRPASRTTSPVRSTMTESHASLRSGKSVQFADDTTQSQSDPEFNRSHPRQDRRRRRRSGRNTTSPASDGSEETIVLPDRFDAQGRPKARQDSVAEAVEDFLRGNSKAGMKFNEVLDGLLGGVQAPAGGPSDVDRRRRRESDDYIRRNKRDRDRQGDRDDHFMD